MVKIVVVLHLGNALARTAFQEFEFRMHYIPTFDLIVTVNDSVRDTQFIRRSNGVVKIVRVENIGADLGAFFQILHLLKDYEVVLKLHSKSFRGERRLHFKRLLASSQSVANIISKLKKGDFGMYAAKKLRVEGYDFSLLQLFMKENLPTLSASGRIGDDHIMSSYFAAGTCFWARCDIFKDIDAKLQLARMRERKEYGKIRHVLTIPNVTCAWERFFGILCRGKGFGVGIVEWFARIATFVHLRDASSLDLLLSKIDSISGDIYISSSDNRIGTFGVGTFGSENRIKCRRLCKKASVVQCFWEVIRDLRSYDYLLVLSDVNGLESFQSSVRCFLGNHAAANRCLAHLNTDVVGLVVSGHPNCVFFKTELLQDIPETEKFSDSTQVVEVCCEFAKRLDYRTVTK